MRRSDREVREDGQIVEIMNRCPVLHLGLRGEKAPYLLPVNFGMEPDGMTLYIHGAMTGTKYDLLARDNRAGFNMTLAGALVLDTENHSCSMKMPDAPEASPSILNSMQEKSCCFPILQHVKIFPCTTFPICSRKHSECPSRRICSKYAVKMPDGFCS